MLITDGCDISHEIALRWLSLDLTDDKSTLVQAMAWCSQVTCHHLNQCWPRSVIYSVTRPQWVLRNIEIYLHFLSFLEHWEDTGTCSWNHSLWTAGTCVSVSVSWLLTTRWCAGPGHQRPQYWPSSTGILRFHYQKDQGLTKLDIEVASTWLGKTMFGTLGRDLAVTLLTSGALNEDISVEGVSWK